MPLDSGGSGVQQLWDRCSAEEFGELQQAGYVVPTEKFETAHATFVMH